jgi:hypothetical protein
MNMEFPEKGANFLEQIIIDDLKSGKVKTVATRTKWIPSYRSRQINLP